MRQNRAVAVANGHVDGGEGFAQRADLIDFHEDRIGGAGLDPFFQEADVGDEQIIAHKLYFLANPVGEELPAGPVVLGKSIFQRADRIFLDPLSPVIGHRLG